MKKKEKGISNQILASSFHKTTTGKPSCIFPYLYSLILPTVRGDVFPAGEKILQLMNLQTDLVSIYEFSTV